MEDKQRNFLKEFRERMELIDKRPIEIIIEEKKVNITKGGRKFNIHKRSLPPGIDIIVVFGVTKEEAEMLLNHTSKNLVPLLKPKRYQNAPDENSTVIYYDIVPVDATPRERSIYFNGPEIIKGEN